MKIQSQLHTLVVSVLLLQRTGRSRSLFQMNRELRPGTLRDLDFQLFQHACPLRDTHYPSYTELELLQSEKYNMRLKIVLILLVIFV